MNNKAEWRSWSTLIFWGVVALTIFGWIAGIFELFSGLAQAVQSIVNTVGQFGLLDDVAAIQESLDGFNTLMSTFEILTILSWAVYLFGLYKFRYAQASASAKECVRRVNNAAWVGVVAAFFVIVAGWAPWFMAWVFRFISWIFATISYFMFRSAFRDLESEETWSVMARKGASLLRKSANYNIWLQFMPLIIFVIALIVGMVTYQSIMNSAFYGAGSETSYWGWYIFIGIIVGLIILALSIIQLIYRIWGWNRIMRGEPVESEESDEGEPSIVDKYIWFIIGGGAALIIAVVLTILSSGRETKNDDSNITDIYETVDSIEEMLTDNSEMTTEEALAYEETEMEAEDDWDATTTEYWEGYINGKWKIEMTVHRLDGMVWGSYCYSSRKTDIELNGEWGENKQLTLTESVDGKTTGQFIGQYGESVYEGLWISADGEKDYPFKVELKQVTP